MTFLLTFGLSIPLPDDTRAVHPGSAAQRAPPAGGVDVRRPGLPGSGHLRLEEEMLVLLHPPPPRHHDSQPGSHDLDPQSHELHSGKRPAPARQVADLTVYARSVFAGALSRESGA